MTTLVVVAGPTSTGKTRAALALARALDGELVGADSVQIYRGFDVGSAKPTATELDGVPHHLIDAVDPDAEIDAAAYAALADEVIARVAARGRIPIVVGGTGLWLRALVRGLVDVPAVDAALRARLEAEAAAEDLHARLRSVDPASARAIHPNDRLRVVRALEVFEQTGIPMSVHRDRHALGAPRYASWFVVVDADDRAAHRAAVEQRTADMLERGWVDEVRSLRARWGDGVRALGAVGYRQILEHLRDGVGLAETRRRIVKATWIYARRQRTWFKNEPGIDWRTTARGLASPAGIERAGRALAAATAAEPGP